MDRRRMATEPPIVGHYSCGHHVTISDVESSRDLRLLGVYGSSLQEIDRKKAAKMGPSDKWLLDSKLTGSSALFLSEAFYLTYALGYMQIVYRDSKEPIDIGTIWSKFRQIKADSCSRLDFALEYGVYHYFKSRDWVVKTGHNYGTHFMLYREGPPTDHAKYAVYIIDQNCGTPKWDALLTLQRVVQSVCKQLLLVYVTSSADKSSPSCIRSFQIAVRAFENKLDLISS